MSLWDDPSVPKRNWTLVGLRDIRGSFDAEDTIYATCEMCGREEIRYVHTVRHSRYPGVLDVGCVCAEKLTDDYVNPKKQEKALRNKASRRATFFKKVWKKDNSDKFRLRFRGVSMTIFPNHFNPKRFSYKFGNKFSTETYASSGAARDALFDELEKIERSPRKRTFEGAFDESYLQQFD